jgi:hypothetical protein
LGFAIEKLAREHLSEARSRVDSRVGKTMDAVKTRLEGEISYWDSRSRQLELQETAGKTPKLNSARARTRSDELTERMRRRMLELEQERHLSSLPPVVVGGAVIVPQGLIDRLDGIVSADPTREQQALARTLALSAAIACERKAGHDPVDVSADNAGYDILSRPSGGGSLRFLKVNAVAPDANSVSFTKNEVLTCLNKPNGYWLVLVTVEGGTAHTPRYVRAPFSQEVEFAATSVSVPIGALVDRPSTP